MDDLDRVFHRLVSNIRHRFPEYLTLPFTVQELYESLIPYRHHRRELGIETNQDYEIAMTRLLSGERDYLQADQAMREKLKSELESAHGDPGAFREFAGSKVSLAPEALRRIRALTASPSATDTSESAVAAAGSEAESSTSGQEESDLRALVEGSTPIPSAVSPRAAEPVSRTPPGTPTAASGGSGFSATFPVSGSPPRSPGMSAADQAAAAWSTPVTQPAPESCGFCGSGLPEGRTIVYCPHCGNNLSISRCPACGSELEKGWKFCATCGRTVG